MTENSGINGGMSYKGKEVLRDLRDRVFVFLHRLFQTLRAFAGDEDISTHTLCIA